MFASELILGFRYLLCDSPAYCRFPRQWEVLKHSFKPANGSITLYRLLCPTDVGVMLSIFTQLAVKKICGIGSFMRKLAVF